jgi:hypothetical protein
MSISRITQLSRSDLEVFLTTLYKVIAGQTPISQKVVYLQYFEVMCKDTKLANILVNSSLLKLFLNILRTAKSVVLRSKLLHVLAVLIRHATSISESVKDLQILGTFSESLRDKEVPVRRSASACLGEFLFYITTQETQPNVQSLWKII